MLLDTELLLPATLYANIVLVGDGPVVWLMVFQAKYSGFQPVLASQNLQNSCKLARCLLYEVI